MNLPIRFYEKKHFSIIINNVKDHQIKGCFDIDYWGISQRFSALSYKPKPNLLHFTFSIDWTLAPENSFTVFSAFLKTKPDCSLLYLNWLFVDKKQSYLGAIRLLENFPEEIEPKQYLPFPPFDCILN